MTKVTLFNFQNVKVSAKGIATGFVASLPFLITRAYFNNLNNSSGTAIIALVGLFGAFVLWGYFARKFWGWK